jgi:hypothetical protein
MEGLVSPTSPKAFRKETAFIYASGWPPAFLGDLYYCLSDYDLRATASRIEAPRLERRAGSHPSRWLYWRGWPCWVPPRRRPQRAASWW